jgi:hypothetical protein
LPQYEPSRLLIALYKDGIVRFDDISQNKLLLDDPLVLPYPDTLSYLSIDIRGLLDDPLLWASLNSAEEIKATQVSFLPGTLELFVTFSTGEVIAWKYPDRPNDTPVPSDDQWVDLSSLETGDTLFQPQFLFNCKEGPLGCFSACEAGM